MRGRMRPDARWTRQACHGDDDAAAAEAAAARRGAPAPPMRRHQRRGHRPNSRLERQREPAARAGISLSKGNGLNAAQVVQRYAAGTVLQAGPGIPAWRYNSYNYYWSGPVESADTVRFIYVGPVVLFFWRLIGVVALAALFAWLALLSYGKRCALPGCREGRLRGRAAGIAGARAMLTRHGSAARRAPDAPRRRRDCRATICSPSSRRVSPPRPPARRTARRSPPRA